MSDPSVGSCPDCGPIRPPRRLLVAYERERGLPRLFPACPECGDVVHVGSHSYQSFGSGTIALLQAASPYLWIGALLFFGLGDLLTTVVGLMGGRVAEAGPLAAALVERYGLGVLGMLKIAAIGVCYALWRLIPRPYAVGTPLGLAVLGMLVTGWNSLILLLSVMV